ncbi:hypothetical protein F5888DRAFT_1805217 [Russula emetica]|nr:hypothetical protein F5888DRAFT_1805217 [Russula emetica]
MGPINPNQLQTVFLLNSLTGMFESLQSHLIGVANDPSFSSKTIMRRFTQEDGLSRCRTDLSLSPTTFAAQSRGGGMAGHSIDDTKAAQCAASSHQSCTEKPLAKAQSISSTNIAATNTATSSVATPAPIIMPEAIVIGGTTYYLAPPSQPSTANIAMPRVVHIETVNSDSDDSVSGGHYLFNSYLALSGLVKASVDWTSYLCGIDNTDISPSLVVTSASHVLVAHTAEHPFILDSGASNHISPECSDFHSLCPIIPHPIQGFNGSSTDAIGIGDINLCIASGHKTFS